VDRARREKGLPPSACVSRFLLILCSCGGVLHSGMVLSRMGVRALLNVCLVLIPTSIIPFCYLPLHQPRAALAAGRVSEHRRAQPGPRRPAHHPVVHVAGSLRATTFAAHDARAPAAQRTAAAPVGRPQVVNGWHMRSWLKGSFLFPCCSPNPPLYTKPSCGRFGHSTDIYSKT